jgi:hypothetical protein
MTSAILSFNGLTLQSFPYFIYSIHTGVFGFLSSNDLGKILPFPGATRVQNGLMTTMEPLLMPVTAPNALRNAPALGPIPINLNTDFGLSAMPIKIHQRKNNR